LSFAKAKKKIFYDELANENNKHSSMMENQRALDCNHQQGKLGKQLNTTVDNVELNEKHNKAQNT
jgi:hypothetical protein